MMFKFKNKDSNLTKNNNVITVGSVVKHTPLNERYFEVIELNHTGQKGPRYEVKEDTNTIKGKILNFNHSMINSNTFNIVNKQGITVNRIKTSPIISMKEQYGNIFIETKNTIYILKDVTKEIKNNRQNFIFFDDIQKD